jgi:D-alanyl-lipoteichoic acid acyltransferase DltB (MBOAT superfamily)
MLFNSVTFFLFFLTVLLLYFLLPHRKQNVLILVASATFYAAWDFRFLGLMYISILTDYVCGRVLGRTPKESTRKLFLSVSILINLGILFFFKYFNFFTASAERLLHAFGLAGWTHSLHIILPVGISFYTFQCMSYSIDVYRREQTPHQKLH